MNKSMNFRIKKNFGAMVVLCALAPMALAQSNVTLFGAVDANYRSVKNGNATIKQMGTDGLNSSRLGFRGLEDLGGGLKAGFWLEHGLQVDTGTPTSSKFWNRRSTVSLMGDFGELRLGRDYTPTFWNMALFDPFGALGLGSSMNLVAPGPALNVLGTGALTAVRADNAAGYFLPATLGGVYGQAMIAAGEGTPGNSYSGVRLGYATGPIDVALAVAQTKTLPDKLKMVNFGASYDLKVVKLMALVNESKTSKRKQLNWQIGATVPIGVSELRVAYHRADPSGAGTDANEASQLALGYVYNLSKRTAIYSHYARISNSGVANYTVAQPPGAAASQRSSAYEVGLRHFF